MKGRGIAAALIQQHHSLVFMCVCARARSDLLFNRRIGTGTTPCLPVYRIVAGRIVATTP